MSERVACAIDCDFGYWPRSVMIASARRTDNLTSPTDLEHRVKAAALDWLKHTVEGQTAYHESCREFNAGDLLPHLNVPSLRKQLAGRGVIDFNLSAPVQLVGWDHDERLLPEPT